jgi:hypothetical protein
MMIDDYKDKLDQLLGRMTTEQVRQVCRFAQFIYEDQEPEGMRANEDPAERYQEFTQWCQAKGIDLGTVESWEQDVESKTAPNAPGSGS